YRPIIEWATNKRSVLSVDDETLRLSPDKVLGFFSQGTKLVVEVKTRLGRTLRCTSSHPVLTSEGWKPVNELKLGNYLAAPRALPYFGHDAMSEAHIKLIAYILSDGSASYEITVTNMLPDVAEDINQIADAFGMKVVRYKRKGNKAEQFRFTYSVGQRGVARQEFAESLRKTKNFLDIK